MPTRLFLAFFLVVLSSLSSLSVTMAMASPGAEPYQEGKHYFRMAQPVRTLHPDKIEVTEVFWYGCSHCFHFEPVLEAWLKDRKDDVYFRASPAMWNERMKIHAQAFYTAEALGVLDKLHQPLFDALNLQRKTLANRDEIEELFVAHGVDAADFRKAFDSFGVVSQVRQADARARSYGIAGTPEMIVNGKYRITTASAGGQKEMLKVAEYLIGKERDAKAK